MHNVISTIYQNDLLHNLHLFFATSALFTFIVFLVAIVAHLIEEDIYNYRNRKLAFKALLWFFVFFFGFSVTPSPEAQQKLIKASILTALGNDNLSVPEREYLQTLAASYSEDGK